MNTYKWNVLDICEMRWKGTGESTNDDHKIYFSGRGNNKLATIRLRASPFNFEIVQVYAPTTSHSEEEIEDFYHQVQAIIDETPKHDILVVQGDWNAKIEDAQTVWKSTCEPYCNKETNGRDLRLLEFASNNNLSETTSRTLV